MVLGPPGESALPFIHVTQELMSLAIIFPPTLISSLVHTASPSTLSLSAFSFVPHHCLFDPHPFMTETAPAAGNQSAEDTLTVTHNPLPVKTVAQCNKVIDDYRGGLVTKIEAITKIQDIVSDNVGVKQANTALKAVGSYLAILNNFDHFRDNAANRQQQVNENTGPTAGGGGDDGESLGGAASSMAGTTAGGANNDHPTSEGSQLKPNAVGLYFKKDAISLRNRGYQDRHPYLDELIATVRADPLTVLAAADGSVPRSNQYQVASAAIIYKGHHKLERTRYVSGRVTAPDAELNAIACAVCLAVKQANCQHIMAFTDSMGSAHKAVDPSVHSGQAFSLSVCRALQEWFEVDDLRPLLQD
ncbi:unnamed protein product [Cyclocybe aegerita]|uniref:RNase H type-1 domain-containing protein n=1 Tax=Cyclocybe aegerita TaxID=1973307 RepID=A0A8S0VUT4_CYCAE|nr:unnamed protein product [Cyclocybe aegerita]